MIVGRVRCRRPDPLRWRFLRRDLPLLAAVIFGGALRTIATVGVTLIALAGLGYTGARIGGAEPLPATMRVTVWGAIAMAVTYGIGAAIGSIM